ncbi:DUF4342 domain-containing protein [Actinomyces minihominis]|uniref:DUF4342 domain-containing protein n=1 Tax=Actinomyces minihominis TaxID=2002838 RepID=UPI000C08B6DF|nr:DUF4342 domain-containing protein [Actinomyces minihominis]
MAEASDSKFSETFTVTTANLTEKVKELIEQGNARRIIIRNKHGKELLNVPLTGSAVAGGVLVLAAPVVAALGVIVALVSSVQIEIITDKPVAEDEKETGKTIAINLTKDVKDD